MLTIVLASLISASNASSLSPLLALAQANPVAAPSADTPTSRRACRNIPIPNSRFTRRVCSDVVAQRPTEAQEPAPATPVITTLGVGMSVVDSQGGAVGTITAIAADSVTVETDKHQAQLPQSSFTISDGKALFGLTQTELNASIEKINAATPQPELKVGAAVIGTAGASVGTIGAVTADNVTINLASGLKISIPRSGIAAQADGSGLIGVTVAELEAQVEAAQPVQ